MMPAFAAAVYTCMMASATPATADRDLDALADLRTDDMRKLVLKDVGPAPDVGFETVEGTTINLKEMKGKVLLVNFWACLLYTSDAADD